MPRQQRARAAVARILGATGHLLDEAGFDALTTTAVAERADVNIATLYRYFPDKFSLVEALAVSLEADRTERTVRMLQAFVDSGDWRVEIRAILEMLLDMRLKRVGARGLRLALHSAPQLWEVERGSLNRFVERFAAALRARVPTMTPKRAEAVSHATVRIVVGLIDWGMAEPAQRRTVLREGGLALERYLAEYLDRGAPGA
ncbi:MAG TPA: TetR/AcrR family transcriptional regulator [Burkholderiaceae bacterium]|nr:TetR/AcrR family transcriptional regulator [Burkholderiaceae bacterium]